MAAMPFGSPCREGSVEFNRINVDKSLKGWCTEHDFRSQVSTWKLEMLNQFWDSSQYVAIPASTPQFQIFGLSHLFWYRCVWR